MSLRRGSYVVRRWVRFLAGPALLVGLAATLDVERVVERLVGLRPGWVGWAIALSVAQTVLSAWRWRYTAARLGLDLPLGRALREYYLAVFMNQVLPGAVLGDASRAWRHARSSTGAGEGRGRAVRAVLLERASGQAVMAIVAAASLLVVGPELLTGTRVPSAATVVVLGALALCGGWVAARAGARIGRRTSPLARLWADARRALLTGSALVVQVGTSTLIVASYVAIYLVAARAVGVETPIPTLAPLVAPVLLSMLIPLTVAGWGVREGAAAAVWGLAGLSAADGIAISVAYGVLVLVGTLPGAVVAAGAAQQPVVED